MFGRSRRESEEVLQAALDAAIMQRDAAVAQAEHALRQRDAAEKEAVRWRRSAEAAEGALEGRVGEGAVLGRVSGRLSLTPAAPEVRPMVGLDGGGRVVLALGGVEQAMSPERAAAVGRMLQVAADEGEGLGAVSPEKAPGVVAEPDVRVPVDWRALEGSQALGPGVVGGVGGAGEQVGGPGMAGHAGGGITGLGPVPSGEMVPLVMARTRLEPVVERRGEVWHCDDGTVGGLPGPGDETLWRELGESEADFRARVDAAWAAAKQEG